MKRVLLSLACAALLGSAPPARAEVVPADFDQQFLAARDLAISGQRDAALAAYSALLEASPGNVDVLLGRGRVYAWMGCWPDAELDLRAATDTGPTADAWSALGDMYLWSDRPLLAVEAYGRWLALSAGDEPAPLLARGRAFRAAGDLASARADFEAAGVRGADPAEVAQYLRSAMPPAATTRAPDSNVRAAGGYRWSASLGVDRSELPSAQLNWTDYVASVRRYFDRGSLAVEALTAKRFGISDQAWALDGYVDLWKRAYLNLRFQQGPSEKLFPRTRWRAELFQGVGQGWELSGSVDRMNFNTAIDLYGVGIGRYYRNWYVRLRHLYIPSTASAPSSSNSDRLVVRYYYAGDGDNYIEVAGGLGRSDQATSFIVGPLPANHSWSGSAAFVKYVNPHLGFKLGINVGYGLESEPYSNRGIFGSVYTRW